MTSHFKNMLYLFGANATGRSVQTEDEVNIEEIRRLAIEQGIWTMVYPELAKLCDTSQYQIGFFQAVSQGIAKKEFNLKMIRRLEDAGIRCCLLKGAALSGLYNDPECRVSSDTDILINPDDEKRAKEFLKRNGYSVEDRLKQSHHTQGYHPIGGLIEVHVALYSEEKTKLLFNGLDMYSEPWTKMEIGGYSYNVLGINDGLMYLTAHYIKHLVSEGGGVRQMMDLLLYIEKYREKIDFDRYNKILKELKYDKLIDVVKTVGAKYFGFNYEIKYESLADEILSDSEKGGIFGHEADDRKNFYDAYCDRRTTMSKYGYKAFIMFRSYKNIFNKLFPNSQRMVNIYGYKYAKNKALLPVAWLNRYFDILFGRRKSIIRERKETGVESRLKMMRDLGMISK